MLGFDVLCCPDPQQRRLLATMALGPIPIVCLGRSRHPFRFGLDVVPGAKDAILLLPRPHALIIAFLSVHAFPLDNEAQSTERRVSASTEQTARHGLIS